MDLFSISEMIQLSMAVQKSVESGNYIFLAVIVIMFLLQICKFVFRSKNKHMAQYSALAGVSMGAVGAKLAGSDVVSGAAGGLIVGNAASGFYSSIVKPVFKTLLKYFNIKLGLIIGLIPVFYGFYFMMKKSKKEKRRELVLGLDDAFKKLDQDKPSTRELEKWINDL